MRALLDEGVIVNGGWVMPALHPHPPNPSSCMDRTLDGEIDFADVIQCPKWGVTVDCRRAGVGGWGWVNNQGPYKRRAGGEKEGGGW